MSICLVNVTLGASAQSCQHQVGIIVLTQENYFAVGRELSYPPAGFESIQLREAKVQQDQVRLQVFGFPNGFESLRRLGDDLPFWPCLKQQMDLPSPIFEIINNENASYE
jgi:hypothetical protein